MGKNFRHMRKKYGNEAFGFHPLTFVLPEDKLHLIKQMNEWDQYIEFIAFNISIIGIKNYRSEGLWIVKPPHTNNGSGVYVIKSPDEIPDAAVCIQQYIHNPLLINGKKVGDYTKYEIQ